VKEARRRLDEAARPTCRVMEAEVLQKGDSPSLLGKAIPGELATKHIGGCGSVSLLLLTLGPGVDRLISGSDDLGAFLIDGISSELAEFGVREVDRRLRKSHENVVGGPRISPGYSDLPLELNGWMVEALDGAGIGVTVVPGSFQMMPRKTITAFIGWRAKG